MPTSAGALTQLVAIGAIDNLINGDAQHTFWRSGYSRSTRFSMESIKQDFSTSAHFGTHAEVTVSRTGDLIYHMYLMLELPGISIARDDQGGRPPASVVKKKRSKKSRALDEPAVSGESPCAACDGEDSGAFDQYSGPDNWRQQQYGACENCNDTIKIERSAEDCEYEGCPWVHWANAIGQLVIKECRLEIGGSKIDDLWGEYLFCFEELAGKVGRRLLEMVGKRYSRQELIIDSAETRRLYVPLPFWFTQNSGHALSLTSLQFHSVKVWVRFRELADCLVVNMPSDDDGKPIWPGYKILNCAKNQPITDTDLKASLLSTYVYLDQPERERFATGNMEYIVCQHQRMSVNSQVGSDKVQMLLNFNHPVVELIWFVRRRCNQQQGAWFNFSGLEMRDPIKSVSLKLNAQDRLDPEMNADYYRLVQPYQHHSCIPDTFVYCYSFGLHPEDSTVPSGACNFSRIDHSEFDVTLQDGLQNESVELMLFATNWNVIRFKEGLAGMAYSN